MPRRKTRVSGMRSAVSAVEAEPEIAIPRQEKGLYIFCSKASSYQLSLTRRRVFRGPDGEATEEALRTKADNPMDWIKFENHEYKTTDPELAERIHKAPGYGLGLDFWDMEEQRVAQDVALEAELRRSIESRPDIAAKVIKPSGSKDFVLPPVN